MSTQPVHFSRLHGGNGHTVALARLNTPATLNALTLEMVEALDAQLVAWAADPEVALVVLHGAGARAFCAGGDVHAMRDVALGQARDEAVAILTRFFAAEYRLDHRIHRYPKPILAWGDGIVMGGGLGLLAGASHRVVTENSRLAMPEINIGLYPDVGASHFLGRLDALGRFLALTAATLNAADALHCRLADIALESDAFPALLERLAATRWRHDAQDDRARLTALLSGLAAEAPPTLAPSPVAAHRTAIETIASRSTLAEFAAALDVTQDDWLASAREQFAAGSPSSRALIWEIGERLKDASLAEALRAELALSVNTCLSPDFAEGVRAQLVDKDKQPRWQPATLAEVDPADIAARFDAPWRGPHPLAELD
ncbi:enoyl-CoA hydratase/isomerase family protein [Crenobacter cavernae]|uniref:3-hydroxyisobutyryl-CoA hydrolase n=1 Tax=Crenobacter cavernae TaxID=2290923 RepID=A0A345Y910_9NEIS|nr:enoyl-CoA hydratase/isomerase family protein [Crenobacter cavernae]AXK40412.1 enoyl-CoA hydratase/isomerase family protein [Crenobacter cavernae]